MTTPQGTVELTEIVFPAVANHYGTLFGGNALQLMAKAAFLAAANACHRAGGQAGIALSDPFCVDRHRDDFPKLVSETLDYVIGNAHEWESLYQTNLDEALRLATASRVFELT